MKKKLLYLTSILLFSSAYINAQNVYDFGGETIAGYTNLTSVAVLNSTSNPGGIYPLLTPPNSSTAIVAAGAANTGNTTGLFTVGKMSMIAGGKNRIRTNNPAVTRYDENLGVVPAFAVAPTYTGRIYANGVGNGVDKHTFKFALNVGDKLTLLVSSDATGTIPSTNATYVIAGPTPATSSTTTVPNAKGYVIHIDATVAGDYLFYDTTSKLAIYRVYEADVTDAVLGTQTFKEAINVGIYANDGAINVSNVTSATKVSVYSVLGSLVKSIETSEDTSVQINNGVYIVKAQSAEGSKTTKVIVQ